LHPGILAEELVRQEDFEHYLRIAISEAIEDTLANENTRYCLGSVLNHVLMHQTVVGLEAKKQFEMLDVYPDVVIGCIGGGSNFAEISALVRWSLSA